MARTEPASRVRAETEGLPLDVDEKLMQRGVEACIRTVAGAGMMGFGNVAALAPWPLMCLASCTAPVPQPLVSADVASTVAARATAPGELIEAALALHQQPPLGLRLPTTLDPRRDADRDVFWHAHAMAFDSTVRAARRVWRASRAGIDASGQPGPVALGYRLDDVDDPSRLQDVSATVDLLGLIGLGTSPAERRVVRRLADVAVGRLDEAVWRAVFAVDAARVGLAAATRRNAALAELFTEAQRDFRRIELLHQRGHLGRGLLGRAQAILAGLSRLLSSHAATTAKAREALALAAGLPPEAPALAAATTALTALDEALTDAGEQAADRQPHRQPHDPAPVPTATTLLDRLPRLRALRRDYALDEARLRHAAASAWPQLRVGPSFKILADEFLPGGVVSLSLPWPSAVAARINRAAEQRAATREAIEDALAATQNAATARRHELVLARRHRLRDVAPLTQGSARAWRAARARLSVHDSVDVLDAWFDAVGLRTRGVLAGLDAAERELLADLAYRQSAGLSPGLDSEVQR